MAECGLEGGPDHDADPLITFEVEHAAQVSVELAYIGPDASRRLLTIIFSMVANEAGEPVLGFIHLNGTGDGCGDLAVFFDTDEDGNPTIGIGERCLWEVPI